MKTAKNLLMAGWLLLCATAAHATLYQIGPTRGANRDQLTDIASLLNPGDVVEVDGSASGAPPNQYNTVRFERSGTAANPIIIRGVVPQGGRRPVIRGGDWTLHVRADHYVVENLEVAESVAGANSSRCVYLEGFNITFRRTLVRDCNHHGILLADYMTGNILIEEVEVTRIATGAGGSNQYHAMYVSTDISEYPQASVTVRNSWIHGSASGNGIKSRAGRTNVYNNWVEIKGNFYPVQINGSEEHECIIPRDDDTLRGCDADIVGNVFIAYGSNIFNVGDTTGENRGRIRLVNNTFLSGSGLNDNYIRLRGEIESLEMHNNILYMQRGLEVNTFVRDIEAVWLRGQRTIVGSNNVVTITNNKPSWDLTGTVYVNPTTAVLFKNVNFANDSAAMDVALANDSVARNAGTTTSTNLPGFEIANPLVVPLREPVRLKPLPAGFPLAALRPVAANADGTAATGKISAGAYEARGLFALTVLRSGAGQATYGVNPNGVSCGADCIAFPVGTSVNLSGSAAPGSIFAGWTGCNGGTQAGGVVCLVTMSSPQTVTIRANLPQAIAATHFDFNNDRRSEIMWFHEGTKLLYQMQVNGTTVTGGAGVDTANSADWRIAGFGDINANGNTDTLWRNNATGQVRGQLMTGSSVNIDQAILTEPNLDWKIEQVVDVGGDARADLVWRNQVTGAVRITALNTFSVVADQVVYVEPNLNWKIVASGDMNGDGKGDLLWRNTVTGDVFAMLMDGFTVLSGGVIYNEPNLNWTIVGLADFNGDGRADVLWRNTATGDVFQMQMNGTTVSAGQVIYNEPAAGWKIVALGDYDANGRADILWRNNVSGQVYMMLMNGFTISAANFIYAEPDQAWTILGP
jgi:hypothetical protein